MTSIFRTLFAYALACLVAALVIVVFAKPPAQFLALAADDRAQDLANSGMLVLKAATHSAIFAAPFALIAILMGALLGTRSVLFYAISGLAISLFGFAALQAAETAGQPTILNSSAAIAYVLSGLTGGITYWLFAGRYVGPKTRTGANAKRKYDRTPPPIVTAKR